MANFWNDEFDAENCLNKIWISVL